MALTQLLAAKAGEITPEMEFCAKREEVPAMQLPVRDRAPLQRSFAVEGSLP